MKSQIPIAAKPIAIAAANGSATAPIAVAPNQQQFNEKLAIMAAIKQQQQQHQQQQQGFISAPFYQLYMVS